MLDRLLSFPQREELLRKIRPARHGGVIAPVRGSSASLVASLIQQDSPKQTLVVAPRLDDAEQAAMDLATLMPDSEVLYFPEFEILPYDRRSPYKGITGQQVEVLHHVLSGEPCVVVTSSKGLKWKVQPPEEILDYTLQFSQGEEVEYESVVERFGEMGYYAVPRVEAPGDFARKGGILDVFSVSYENPIRIEFFGDEIESIRFFDATTQRSLTETRNVTVPPCSPLILSSRNVERALKAVEGASHGKNRERDQLKEHIRERLHFEGMERYAPFYSKRVLLTEFFLADSRLIWLRPETCAGHLKRLSGEVKKLFDDAVRSGQPVPEPSEVYASDAEIHALSAERETVFLCESHLGRAPLDELVADEDESGPEPGSTQPEMKPASATETTTKPSALAGIRLNIHAPESYGGRVPALRKDLLKRLAEGQRIHIFCDNEGQAERLRDLLEDAADRIDFPIGELQSGFVLANQGVVVLTDREIFERYKRRARRRKYRTSQGVSAYEELTAGDFVVHVNYGIARYLGIEKIKVESSEIDCLKLAFAGGDRIFVTVDQLNMVEKYVGKEGVEPGLTKLGTQSWERTKERAKKAINEMAEELLEMAAIRQARKGFAYSADNQLQKELEASFIYEETPDQITAIRDVKNDMQSDMPMDRLICGDVGYGKTEVAIRAAFKAVSDSKQVAVLVPTTILAQQHLTTFKERFADFPVSVEMLSRLRSVKEQKEILQRTAQGKVDILIGTHRILSRDVHFKSLGLIVVDEEHRFGVRHKERLKDLKKTVDVISMSATPIPRTLNMSLIGLRDMSLINTAPRDRLPVQTEIIPFDEEIIVDSIMREIDRGGQVYFVHNRVQSIEAMAGYIKRVLPTARVGIGHGQMNEKDLERVMLDFLDQKYDVLVSTMIIESGLDIPSVNTMIVNRADRLGLAQLYQLRGRVGRSSHKAYAYFMVPRGGSTTELARKRLSALQEFEALGSGLRIAMRDLEIRGAGNILGSQQHGQLIAIGFELYCRLLEETVAELQGREIAEDIATTVEVDADYRIPQRYIPDAEEKMRVYKRVAKMTQVAEVDALVEELEDRYGALPETAKTLLEISRIRILGWRSRVDKVSIRGAESTLSLKPGAMLTRMQIENLVRQSDNKLAFDASGRFKIKVHLRPGRRLAQVAHLLENMMEPEAETANPT